MLHVTNGDSAAARIARAGPVLPWRECLHEGPVTHLELGPLRAQRAQFLPGGDAIAWLEAQDAALARASEVTLWFEADLYDALSVWQIVSRLEEARLHWFGGERWEPVGPEPPGPPLAVEASMFHDHWHAFVAGRPDEIPRDAVLPGMDEIVERLWQQLPWSSDLLTRSERQLLYAIAQGARTREDAFARAQDAEDRPFLGDTWAFAYLNRMALSRSPLLSVEGDPYGPSARYGLTTLGEKVLDGAVPWEPRPPFWLGGARSDAWVYEPETMRLRAV